VLRFLNTQQYPSLRSCSRRSVAHRRRFPRRGATGAVGRVLSCRTRPALLLSAPLPLIHAAALVVSAWREGHVTPWLFTNHLMMNPDPPDGYTWPLWLLYVVFVVVVAILYFPCRWYARMKARGDVRWLRYL
jgi:hypothetical protein